MKRIDDGVKGATPAPRTMADDLRRVVERELEAHGIRDSELLDRLVRRVLATTGPVIGLSLRSLEDLLFGVDPTGGYASSTKPACVREAIADRVLSEYSLREAIAPRAAAAHAEGRIHVHGLCDPVRLEALRWRLSAATAPVASSSRLRGEGAFFGSAEELARRGFLDREHFIRRVRELRQFASGELAISGLGALLHDRATLGSRPDDLAREAIDTVERLARLSSRPRIALEFGPDDDACIWLRALAALPPEHTRGLIIRLRGVGADPARRGAIAHCAGIAAQLYGRGDEIEFHPAPARSHSPPGDEDRGPNAESVFAMPWAAGESGRFPAPAASAVARARGPLVGIAGKVTILLAPLGARYEGAAGRDPVPPAAFLEELDELVRIALEAFVGRIGFVLRLAEDRERPLFELFRRGGDDPISIDPDRGLECALGILGLDECVRHLCGSALHDSSAARDLGLSIVRGIDARLRAALPARSVRVRLEETRASEIETRPEDLLDALVPSLAELAGTDGVRLGGGAPADPSRRLEELVPYLPHVALRGGLVEPLEALRTAASEFVPSLLEAGSAAVARMHHGRVPSGQFLG